jgi:tetratricopeptide (TPR) repeat protein
MTIRASAAALVALLALCIASGTASARCQLSNFLQLPVTLKGLRALVTLNLNGTDETFILDSGAFFNSISPQVAQELKLPLGPPVPGLVITGVGGQMSYHIAKVKDLKIGDLLVHNAVFIAGGTDPGAAGVIGQNLLTAFGDVEYDFANGSVRLWQAKGCGDADSLAYWVKPGQAFSAMDIDPISSGYQHTRGYAYLNGERVHVLFDSGDQISSLSLEAAAHAGANPGAPGVERAGTISGVGRGTRASWVAPFASFKLGDEQILNTHLRFSDLGMPRVRTSTLARAPDAPYADMLVGFDFFLSHRLFVANSQRKLYFTYVGGPVFDLTRQPPPAEVAGTLQPASALPPENTADPGPGDAGPAPGFRVPPPAPGADSPAAAAGTRGGASADTPDTAEPADAAGFARRASILIMRGDYEHAIADLTRAIELEPGQAELFRDRAKAYESAHRPVLARADLDHLLTQKPGDVPALMERATLEIQAREISKAIEDLGAASQAAPKEDMSRLQIGQLYRSAGERGLAITQYDLWLASHKDDARQSQGLLLLSTARAELGQDLDKALSDCDTVLRRISNGQTAGVLRIRALLRLRRGELDKAIEDYSAALKQAPRNAADLYGRGLARLRKGATADGQADLAAARALQPAVDEAFKEIGLTP